MLSLIICSKHPELSPELYKNIQETIGTPFEIVHIDNSQNQYNIFQAYNLGVKRAKGSCLCFMHEDLVFHTHDWGKAVEHHLSNPVVGILGVAGGNIVFNNVDWRFCYGFDSTYIIQGSYSLEPEPRYYRPVIPKLADPHTPLWQVAVVDGLWLCMRKELFPKIRFDEDSFHDFHLYDSDICMQVNTIGLGVFVTHDILIEHQSEGTFANSYRDSLAVFLEKWQAHLPLVRGAFVSSDKIKEETRLGLERFEKRMSADLVTTDLRQVFSSQKKGQPGRNLNKEELAIVDKSSFTCRRRCLKDPYISTRQAWMLVKEYLSLPYARHKIKLIFKFVWYRFLFKPIQQSATI